MKSKNKESKDAKQKEMDRRIEEAKKRNQSRLQERKNEDNK